MILLLDLLPYEGDWGLINSPIRYFSSCVYYFNCGAGAIYLIDIVKKGTST